jgi:hypothetical protein
MEAAGQKDEVSVSDEVERIPLIGRESDGTDSVVDGFDSVGTPAEEARHEPTQLDETRTLDDQLDVSDPEFDTRLKLDDTPALSVYPGAVSASRIVPNPTATCSNKDRVLSRCFSGRIGD